MKRYLGVLLLLLSLASPLFAVDNFGYDHIDSDSQLAWAAGGSTLCSGPISPCGLNVYGQSAWSFYNGSDAPGGGFFAFYDTSALTANVTLPQTLTSAATYYAWVHVCDYQSHATVSVVVGGNTSTTATTTNAGAAIGCWAGPLQIVAGSTTTTMTVNMTRAGGTSLLWDGLYVTTNAAVTVNKQSVAIDLTFPTVMDDSAATGGNILQNSSFEEGIDVTWGVDQHLTGIAANYVDCTVSHSGSCSLRQCLSASCRREGVLDSPAGFTTKIFHLQPNKKYSFGCYVKLDVGILNFTGLSLNNVFVPPAGAHDQYGIGVNINLNAADGWQLLTTTGYAKAYTSSDFYISTQNNGLEGSNLYWDDCFLQQGPNEVYAAGNPLDALISTSKDGSIYYDDDTLTGTLKVYNSTGSTTADVLNYEIYDRFEVLVRSGTTSLSVAGNTLSTNSSYSLSTSGKLGFFRMVYWLEGRNESEKELNYSIVKHPGTSGIDTASYLGIHPNYLDYTSSIFQRMGLKWARAFSPFGPFIWTQGEAVEGTFVYFDSRVNSVHAYGISTLAQIGGDTAPAYGQSGSCWNLTKWSTYVSTMVTHYKAITYPVKYWEFANEPRHFTADCYAGILKTGVDAMEAADGTANAICMGGSPADYITSVLASLAALYPSWNVATHCPTLSTHDYPDGEPPENLKPFVDAGYKMWNTETGSFITSSFQGQGNAWNGFFPGKSLFLYQDSARLYTGIEDDSNKVVQNFARSIGNGQTNYELYDGRIFATPESSQASTSLLGIDLSVRPNGIAYSAMGHVVDKSIGKFNQKSDGDTYAFSYDTGGTSPVAVLYSGSYTAHQIVLDSVSHGDISMFDEMGNSVSFSGVTIPFGRRPIYLVGNSISITTLSNSLHNGTVTSIADIVAPNVAILDGPRASITTTQEPFRMRYLALDDESFPNLGETNQESLASSNLPDPDAILYSYKLAPYSDWNSYTASTYIDYNNIPCGSYVFSVKAKDAAGNVSATNTRNVTISGCSSGGLSNDIRIRARAR